MPWTGCAQEWQRLPDLSFEQINKAAMVDTMAPTVAGVSDRLR
jgi:hypothetical protein